MGCEELEATLNVGGKVFVANWLFVVYEVELIGRIWSREFETCGIGLTLVFEGSCGGTGLLGREVESLGV